MYSVSSVPACETDVKLICISSLIICNVTSCFYVFHYFFYQAFLQQLNRDLTSLETTIAEDVVNCDRCAASIAKLDIIKTWTFKISHGFVIDLQ